MKRLETYNFSNLELYQAIERIIKNENLESDEKYAFDIVVEEGFFRVIVTADIDGVWGYSTSEITFPEQEGDAHLVSITHYNEDGSIAKEYQIVSEREVYALKDLATYSQNVAEVTCNWFEVEDVLVGW